MNDNHHSLVRICPFTRTVEAVEWSGEFKDLTKLLKPPVVEVDGEPVIWMDACGLVEFAPTKGVVELCVDEEGLCTDWPAFGFLGAYQPISGRALVFSADRSNGFIPALDVETVTRMVLWDQVPIEPRFEIVTGDDALRAIGW